MDLLYTLQNIRTPLLDKLMLGITYLGDETVLMVIAGILLWCFNKRRGIRTLVVCLSAMSVTTALKGIFAIPRPWLRDERLHPVEGALSTAEDFSFPSGHSTVSASAYGTLASDAKRTGLRILFAAIALMVVFTRLYLGVHTPTDVLVGVGIGSLFAIAGTLLRRYEENTRVMHLTMAVMTLITLSALLILALCRGDLTNPANYAVMKELSSIGGALLGLTIGCKLEERFVRYETKTTLPFQIVKLVGGFALMVGVKAVLKGLFGMIAPGCPYMDVLRYCLLLILVIAGWPMVFRFFPGAGSGQTKG